MGYISQYKHIENFFPLDKCKSKHTDLFLLDPMGLIMFLAEEIFVLSILNTFHVLTCKCLCCHRLEIFFRIFMWVSKIYRYGLYDYSHGNGIQIESRYAEFKTSISQTTGKNLTSKRKQAIGDISVTRPQWENPDKRRLLLSLGPEFPRSTSAVTPVIIRPGDTDCIPAFLSCSF